MNSKKMTIKELNDMGIDTAEWNLDADTVVLVCEDGSIDLPNGVSVDGPSSMISGMFSRMRD